MIPSDKTPQPEEGLNEEEIRLKGADKLAELISRARWFPIDQRANPPPPPRFLPTTLGPAACLTDENVLAKLEEIHLNSPLQKKPKSEKVFAQYTLQNLAKAMRDEDGVPMKDYKWHYRTYPDSFTGTDLVSWLVREFKDITTREQAVEHGQKLQEKGLFRHCRDLHGFMDG